MIKVGDTFEIGEVLDNLGFEYLKGKQGIIKKHRFGYYFFDYHICPCLMYESEIKPIGRLKVTKLK